MTFPRGLCAFPITPDDGRGRVDTAAMRRLVGRLVAAKVDSIGLLGSTGTYAYRTRSERRRTVETAVEEAGGRAPVVAGIGALTTREAVMLARDARSAGAAAGLLAPVSYTPLADDEVFAHFETLARQGRLPIVVYDNPGTTHFSFTPQLIGRLSGVEGIVAVKRPAGAGRQSAEDLTALRAGTAPGFSIGYSGDWNAAEAMIAGADAWYGVLAGLFPEACLAIVEAVRRGDAAEARRLDAALAPLWDLFRRHSSLRVVYALAGLFDICRSEPPKPILPLPGPAMREVEAALPLIAASLRIAA